jgi:hypothetical protein
MFYQQAWIDEVSVEKIPSKGRVGGNVAWLKEWNSTKNKLELLSKVVASVIFSASVQHASVNFPQVGFENFNYFITVCFIVFSIHIVLCQCM